MHFQNDNTSLMVLTLPKERGKIFDESRRWKKDYNGTAIAITALLLLLLLSLSLLLYSTFHQG